MASEGRRRTIIFVTVNQHPEHARERAVELQAFPETALALEIQIERLVIAAIADVVPEMPLPDEMKRRGKEQGEDRSDEIVQAAMGMQDTVLGFMQHGIGGIHHDAISEGEECHHPPQRDQTGRPENGEHQAHLHHGDSQIEARRDGVRIHACAGTYPGSVRASNANSGWRSKRAKVRGVTSRE
jgi:hypothetical protein